MLNLVSHVHFMYFVIIVLIITIVAAYHFHDAIKGFAVKYAASEAPLLTYIADRLTESSTVQGAVAVIALVTGMVLDDAHLQGWIAVAAMASAIIKSILPDSFVSTPTTPAASPESAPLVTEHPATPTA